MDSEDESDEQADTEHGVDAPSLEKKLESYGNNDAAHREDRAELHRSHGPSPGDGGRQREPIHVDLSDDDGKTATPLFVSSNETRTRSESPFLQSEVILEGLPFAVVVPRVSRRWEYRTVDYDPTVAWIVRDISGKADDISYMVECRDGRNIAVSSDQLLQLPGGPRALERFKSRQSETSKSSESNLNMVSTRPVHPKRSRETGFMDTTKVDLSSDEDELSNAHSQGSRPTRKRGLLSSPKPPVRRGLRPRKQLSGLSLSTESSDSGAPKRRKFSSNGRVTRGIRRTAKARSKYFEDPQLTSESSSSGDSYGHLGKRKRRSSQDHRATRRSERSGRAVGSMRERGEDDIPENVTRTSSKGGIKVVAAKEIFQTPPTSDEFRLRHCSACDTCNEYGDHREKGNLVFCQGCTLSYHQVCLGPRNGREHLVTKVGHRDFVLQCRRCIGQARNKEATAPQQGHCQVCHQQGTSCKPFRPRKTARDEQKERDENSGQDPITKISEDKLNNPNNVLFRCLDCYQAFHMHHLPPRSDDQSLVESDEQQTAEKRFGEYCRDWLCKECVTAPEEIDALVAWRPLDIEAYVPGLSTEQVDEDDKEYLIKWRKMSYYSVTWKGGAWVWGKTHASMRKAFARQDNHANLPKMTTEDAVPEDFLRVDIVLEVRYNNVVSTSTEQIDLARVKEVEEARVKFKGLGYEDVVWDKPPDPEDGERWTDWKTAYEDWVRGHYVHLPNQNALKSHLTKIKSQSFESKIIMNEQPQSLTGGQLMKYQLEGLNWLLYQWHSGQNAILADEMGLGKTIQIIGFLTTLHQVHKCWPFLVIVPNSTCANWRREIKQWAPSLRVVTYFGSSEARRLANQFELFPNRTKELACHVVVTSYDAAQDANVQTVFRRIPWAGLVVDEGQRLKNDKNILYNALAALKVPFKVLLTGTPLQNNQRELFNLLQFLDTSINAQALEEKNTILTKESVAELHELLRPFFLRRTKAQVLDFLPPMAQIIVPVTPSVLQKQLYKSILAKDPELLKSIIGGDKRPSVKGLRNLLMQLRKCLCHPFVYSIAIEERSSNSTVSHRRLVEASSKLQLLEIMLPKLKERGHRVLIFSQFLDMLTIVEDFLDGLGLLHQRLDGTMGSLEKQKRIDEFNAVDSLLFALLLSTRAGGVGINLATADTVIILDPDFNPHQDIQAISRAHRIGQKKKVLIFQLMTRGTAEEKVMQIGKKKMALDHVLIEKMEADDADSNDLESVLRFGAEALFKDDSTQDIHYDSLSVDKLLDRSKIEDTKTGKDDSAESQFSFARVWANETGTMEDNLGTASDSDTTPPDPTLWGKILAERRRQAEIDGQVQNETFGRGKRQRRAINYTKQAINGVDVQDDPEKPGSQSDSDTDFQSRGESEGEESAEDLGGATDVTAIAGELRPVEERPSRSTIIANEYSFPKAGKFRRALVTEIPPGASTTNQLPCLACDNLHAVGYCPVKTATVEYCNLCGLAHYGSHRACPHINSEKQVRTMLNDLPSSPEPRELKQRAKTYLRGVLADLVKGKQEALRSSSIDGYNQAAVQANARQQLAHTRMAFPGQTFAGHGGDGLGTGTRPGGNGQYYGYLSTPDRSYTTPYQPRTMDPHAATFAAASTGPRSFATFNNGPPPARTQ